MQTLTPDILHTSRQLAARLPSNLTGEELSAVLQAAEIFDAYFNLARAEAEKRIAAGKPVDGWEIVATPGRRSIPDTILAARQLAPLLEPHDILACATLRLGDITQAIQDQEGVTEDQAKDILADYLKGNLIKGAGGQKLQLAPRIIELHPIARAALKEYAEVSDA
jgi:hypothetical protein